ncbi:MAG: hypothetical protein UY05_C0050G0005 [Candidatus Peregrinibacteria bacterium GW2011_GWA2_47_7]|nr:MAG: hypothetical protein UY05_C0050G0005 [Candidatus Peregrinibacteria bacterium GW2011_GWA2_47_7]
MDLSDIYLLIILIALSAIFSGSEVALISTSIGKVKTLVKKKKFGAKALEKLKSNPHKMLSTILVGNNIVNTGAAAIATNIATNLYGSQGIGIGRQCRGIFH